MQPNFWCDYCYRQTIEYIWFWSSKWPWKWPTNWPIGWANPFMDRRGKPLSPSLIYLLVEVLSTGPTELGKTLKSILWYWPIDSGLKVWHGFMAQPGTSFVPNIYWLLSSLFCYILMCRFTRSMAPNGGIGQGSSVRKCLLAELDTGQYPPVNTSAWWEFVIHFEYSWIGKKYLNIYTFWIQL